MNGLTINYCLNCFALLYQLDQVVLQWNVFADNIKLIFSMLNRNIIVDTKLEPFNHYWYYMNVWPIKKFKNYITFIYFV